MSEEKITYTMIVDQGQEAPELRFVIIPNNEISEVERAMIEFLSMGYQKIQDKDIYESFKKVWKNLIENEGKWEKYRTFPYCRRKYQNEKVDTVYYFDFF